MTPREMNRAFDKWRTLGAVVSVMIFAGIAYDVADRQQKNHQAIEKGCVLLNNAIIQATSPRPSTVMLVTAAFDNEPALYKAYIAAKAHDPKIHIADCKKLSESPDSLKPEKIPPNNRIVTGP